jgi:flagellum-specific peptidoglycan hydrolase FlgJ
MALESKWGTSKMAVNDHNYFGIKASRRWLEAGRPYNLYDDDKKNEKFCVFGDVIESIEYHSTLLMSERYKSCRTFPSDDWYHWLVSIKACGYATSNRYVQECTRIIKDYRLYRYDKIDVQQL